MLTLNSHRAYPKSHHICFVGFDRHKVIGDYRHGVMIDREALYGFGARIYKPKTVCFPSCEIKGGQVLGCRA